MKPRIQKAPLNHQRIKPGRQQSLKHLNWLRSLECPIYPGLRPIQSHHLLRADPQRGMGRKAADKFAIPLCRKAHNELHRDGDEDAYLSSHGIDGRALAARLWKLTGDSEAGLRAVERAKKVGRVDQ